VVATVLAVAGTVAIASGEVHLAGSFFWKGGDEPVNGDLTTVLTPSGKGEWDVAFHFDWEGEPHVFAGKAKGSLDGELVGNVSSDDPDHPLKFEFRGAFADGEFAGTHGYWNRKGELVPTGTLKLAPAG